MDQWIRAQNIARFERLLFAEADEERRAILEGLLAHERALAAIQSQAAEPVAIEPKSPTARTPIDRRRA